MTTKTKTAPPTYPCGLCGRRDIAERMIYSSWTGSRYCGTGQVGGCERRAAALKRRRRREGGS